MSEKEIAQERRVRALQHKHHLVDKNGPIAGREIYRRLRQSPCGLMLRALCWDTDFCDFHLKTLYYILPFVCFNFINVRI